MSSQLRSILRTTSSRGRRRSAAAEFRDINIDVGLRDPRRQGRRIPVREHPSGHHVQQKPARGDLSPPGGEKNWERNMRRMSAETLSLRGIKLKLVKHRIDVARHERRRLRRAAAKPPGAGMGGQVQSRPRSDRGAATQLAKPSPPSRRGRRYLAVPPSASTRPTMSPMSWSTVYFSTSSGRSLRP